MEVTWWLGLCALDDDVATFGADGTATGLTLPRAEWINMGRPGGVQITPVPDSSTPADQR